MKTKSLRISALLTALVMLVCSAVIPAHADGNPAQDCVLLVPVEPSVDIPEGYTPIRTAQQLSEISNNLGGSFILMNNIDLSGISWQPIGDSDNAFSGRLEGNGYSIRNMLIVVSEDSPDAVGLFGVTAPGSAIRNLRIDCGCIISDISMYYCRYAGLIAGYSESGIYNCCTSGYANGANSVGAVAGYSTAAISLCCNTARVYSCGDDYENSVAGGIVGISAAEISFCCNTGSVSTSVASSSEAGGIVGRGNGCSVSRSCNTGTVLSEAGCRYTSVTSHAGGIAGSYVAALDCFNSGAVTSTVYGGEGGVVSYSGGIAGEGSANRCYNTGEVACTKYGYKSASAIVGASSVYNVKNCRFPDSLQIYDSSQDFSKYDNVAVLTDEQMRNSSNYTGFDFGEVWQAASGELPTLIGLTVPVHNVHGEYNVCLDSSCSNIGYDLTICPVCGKEIRRVEIYTKPHTYSEFVHDHESASLSRHCLVCGYIVYCGFKTITLEGKSTLNYREKTQLTVKTTFWDYDGEVDPNVFELTWKSSDESVATVDDRGVVTATGRGTTIITASADAWVTSQNFTVTVKFTPLQWFFYIISFGWLR